MPAGLSEGALARSRAVNGGAEKPSAPERWSESSGRRLADFQVEALFCQVWSFSVPLLASAGLAEEKEKEEGEEKAKEERRRRRRENLWMAGFWTHQVVPGYPKEEGLLDSLGRLGIDRSSGQISRLVSTLFLAQNVSAGNGVKFV